MKDLGIDYQIKRSIELETEAFGGYRPAAENVIVCLYELGRIARSMIYSRGKLEEKDESLYCAEMCVELADVITQALIMFQKLKKNTKGWCDVCSHDLIYDGIERQQERIGEVIAEGGAGTLGL